MSDEGGIHEISMKLGALTQAVDTMTRTWSEQERTATEGRRKLHDKFETFREEVRDKMGVMSARVDTMAKQITMIEPSVKGFNDEKLREEGAKRLGKVLMGAMGVVAGGIGWGVHELVGWIRHP